jgi:hypothetical protein
LPRWDSSPLNKPAFAGRTGWRILKSTKNPRFLLLLPCGMRDLIVLVVHFITATLRIVRPGGLRSVIAESVLIKHQLLIVNRSRRRAPNLRVFDRLIAGFCSLWIPETLIASSDRIQAIDSIEFPPRSGSAQIPVTVFTKAPGETRAERS